MKIIIKFKKKLKTNKIIIKKIKTIIYQKISNKKNYLRKTRVI